MALTIKQLADPSGKRLIYFQEDAGKTKIIVSRETIEWALREFDLFDSKETLRRSRRARRRLTRPNGGKR